MALGVKQGEEIKVTVDGSDEEHASCKGKSVFPALRWVPLLCSIEIPYLRPDDV